MLVAGRERDGRSVFSQRLFETASKPAKAGGSGTGKKQEKKKKKDSISLRGKNNSKVSEKA